MEQKVSYSSLFSLFFIIYYIYKNKKPPRHHDEVEKCVNH